MSILKNLKNLVMEDEDTPKPAPPPAKQPVAGRLDLNAMPSPPSASPTLHVMADRWTHAPIGQQEPEGLDVLRSKTSFEASDAGEILNKYLVPLKDLAMDERAKVQSAMAQAQAHDGLSATKVLTTFAALLNVLDQESKSFEEAVGQRYEREINDRTNQITQAKAEIDHLQKKLVTLTQEKADEQSKIDHARSEFELALVTRKQELEQLRDHYTSLLK